MNSEDAAKVKQVESALDGKSRRWLENYAQSLHVSFESLMNSTEEWIKYGDYWMDGGKFEGESLPREFWEHYQNVSGVDVVEDKQHSFFSCSC